MLMKAVVTKLLRVTFSDGRSLEKDKRISKGQYGEGGKDLVYIPEYLLLSYRRVAICHLRLCLERLPRLYLYTLGSPQSMDCCWCLSALRHGSDINWREDEMCL